MLLTLGLVVGGLWAWEPAERWWLVRSTCADLVDRADIRRAVDGLDAPYREDITGYRVERAQDQGYMSCGLEFGRRGAGDRPGVSAYASVASRFVTERWTMRPPEGASGRYHRVGTTQVVTDGDYRVRLLVACAPRQQEGPDVPRQLLVEATGSDTATALAIGFGMAASASKELECGAKVPAAPPADALRAAEPRPLAQAVAGCGWLRKAELPDWAERADWQVAGDARRGEPLQRCVLRHERGGPAGPASLRWYAWYGPNAEIALARTDLFPLRSSSTATAQARCPGGPAVFHADGRDWYEADGEISALLEVFARDQVERAGCTDLRLPAGRD